MPLQIQVLPAGAETTLFKQFFCDWKDKEQTTGPTKPYTIGHIAKVSQVPFDASTLHTNVAMAACHGMVDDGKGKVQVRACKTVNTGCREKCFCELCKSFCLVLRSGELRTVLGRLWIHPPTVSSTVETVTSSCTATGREAASSTSYTPGEWKTSCAHMIQTHPVKHCIHLNLGLCVCYCQAGTQVHTGRTGSFSIPHCAAGWLNGRIPGSGTGGSN